MSPRRLVPDPTSTIRHRLDRMFMQAGLEIYDARVRRGWSLAQLAGRAGMSAATACAVEAGNRVSVETLFRLAEPLGIKPTLSFDDGRGRARRDADPVHSAIGELEAGHLRPLGFEVSMDEPYQHYQFAGRADFLAWDLERRALLHCENRTQFPDMQEMAGAWNAKRAYLPRALADRLELRGGWASVTHVMVALWSSEVLHALRLRTETFRALCKSPPDHFERWWSGEPPQQGTTTTLIVLDPLAHGRQSQWIGLDAALGARPRMSSYRDAAERLRAAGRA